MKLREMERADRSAVLDLLEHAFGVRELFERYMDFDAKFAYGDYLLGFDAGELVACVQIFDKTIRLGRESARLGGIGSVATRASHRGKGVSSQLLERALERMRARGMWLSLLFAAPVAPLYEKLGWHKIPGRLLRLKALARASRVTPAGRAFRPDDLWQVSGVYDAYTDARVGPTVRDASYWRGQLHTAGTPEEDFRVAERDGAIVAYARVASFNGRPRVLECARSDEQSADALGELLAAHAHGEHALYMPQIHDPLLEDALEARGIDWGPASDPSPMWRVLERAPLARIAKLPESTDDAALLRRLVGDATYFYSDRF